MFGHLSLIPDQAGELYVNALLVPKAMLPQLKALKFAPLSRACDVEIFVVGMRNLKSKGVTRPLNKPWIELDAGDKADKAKIFKSKSSDTPSKFNPNYFESVKLRVDVPEELCLVPKLSFTATDSLLMREYNIGAANIALLSFLPWLTPEQRDQAKAGCFDGLAETEEAVITFAEPKKSGESPPHVSIDILSHEDENSYDETKPLLSG